ncbi:MAG: hypothetical protein K0R65_156 [Crocinitomicaceae bacterium]|jgi:hypothetical protein|nr:hypothetical protein [Crocinitomicaceae bacterium]
MKNLLLCVVFTCAGLAFSQTKQIAHKSHSGDKNNFFSSDYMDNFGLPPEEIDSIIILKNKCIVEVKKYAHWYGPDTVCDHPYFNKGYSEEQIRAMYPKEIVIVGFENYKAGKKHKAKKTSKKGSFYYLAILIFLGLGASYIFQPKNQKTL